VSRPLFLPSLVRFRLWAHHRRHGVIHLNLSARHRSAACPRCQHHSTAVHRAYRRRVVDVPLSGAKTVLHLQVRRFFCRYAACPQRIFAERFSRLVPARGRHSEGVYAALRNIGLAVGGRAGARLARALGVPGSARMILRLVQRASLPSLLVPRVIGLDEWAWRGGRRFGTIVCDGDETMRDLWWGLNPRHDGLPCPVVIGALCFPTRLSCAQLMLTADVPAILRHPPSRMAQTQDAGTRATCEDHLLPLRCPPRVRAANQDPDAGLLCHCPPTEA
jgi:zinc-finger of transposase IS204/IS1001/IS1096/IS1165